MGVRKPRSVAAAEKLAARFAELEGAIALQGEARAEAIAAINAGADEALRPLLDERDQIAGALEAGWPALRDKLLDGSRKTVELGGCLIGTRKARAALCGPENKPETFAALRKLRGGKALLRVTTNLDRPAIARALKGPLGERLAAIGFAMREGEEAFVLERAEQDGVRA